ncbi:hypothetical protein [Phreatobacter stygius]|uniref:YkgJ family cysteine cluster protein n=1 Tax=Phreatobacter stygius TaxID=1940610 RepID=A0A4D7B6W2_9HYPH|nr:hypothetical protein [Phreatobacter stygius]QCI66683.1 hypothetical protein E8M01_22065 [Phreatobacter stygius]
MGQAKRRKQAGERVSFCRTCTYCCTLPEILALDKPAYRPCRHIANGGCSIFGKPERPGACLAYSCAYLTARVTDSPDRNKIPHPLDCGAYFHRDPVEKVIFLFVDPARPHLWKASAVADLLKAEVAAGVTLFITDRGRQMVVRDAYILGEVLTRDFVAIADAQDRPLDVPSFRQAGVPA